MKRKASSLREELKAVRMGIEETKKTRAQPQRKNQRKYIVFLEKYIVYSFSIYEYYLQSYNIYLRYTNKKTYFIYIKGNNILW